VDVTYKVPSGFQMSLYDLLFRWRVVRKSLSATRKRCAEMTGKQENVESRREGLEEM